MGKINDYFNEPITKDYVIGMMIGIVMVFIAMFIFKVILLLLL